MFKQNDQAVCIDSSNHVMGVLDEGSVYPVHESTACCREHISIGIYTKEKVSYVAPTSIDPIANIQNYYFERADEAGDR